MALINAEKSDDVNPFSGKLTLLGEPYLTSETVWYLATDAARSGEGPQTETRVGFDGDGIEWKVRLDFGGGWQDFRGFYKKIPAFKPAYDALWVFLPKATGRACYPAARCRPCTRRDSIARSGIGVGVYSFRCVATRLKDRSASSVNDRAPCEIGWAVFICALFLTQRVLDPGHGNRCGKQIERGKNGRRLTIFIALHIAWTCRTHFENPGNAAYCHVTQLPQKIQPARALVVA